MVKSVNSKFIPLYFIVLLISYVFYCFYFLCISLFLWVYFFVIWSWLISRYKKLCKWPKTQNTVLVHFNKISYFLVFCTQPYAKCRFWANFVPKCEYKTSRDLTTDGPIFANWVSKDAQDLKEKTHEEACREAVADYVQGGQFDPPPPVRIGLRKLLSSSSFFKQVIIFLPYGWLLPNLIKFQTYAFKKKLIIVTLYLVPPPPPPPPPNTNVPT